MIPPLFRFDNIYRQYIACRRKKRNTFNALRFETVQEIALLQLQRELVERSYRPGRSVCFFLEKPKLREVFAADFRDRVVHHILVDHLEKIWEPVFIYDSYACRKGKGIHLAASRLRKFLRQVTANGRRRAFYLKLDIKNYFMTIDKAVLFGFIRDRLDDEAALWLAEIVLFHDCTINPVITGDPKHLKRIPPHKTLFHAGPGKGLPIGNLNSQFFANVYLNGLDQFIKHSLKCRHYLRYCDDFVLLAEDQAKLQSWEGEIENFLGEKLKLALNQRQRKIAPVSNGIDFLGYVVRPEYVLARRRVVGNMREKLAHYGNLLVKRRQGYLRYAYDEHLVQALQSSLASYLGHLKHANAYNLIESTWRRYPYLRQYFIYDAENMHLRRIYRNAGARINTARGQYAYYRGQCPGDVLFFQVGCFYEFYEDMTEADLGAPLKTIGRNQRGAKGGFPIRQEQRYLKRALDCGHNVSIIGEGNFLGKIKERYLHARCIRNDELRRRS